MYPIAFGLMSAALATGGSALPAAADTLEARPWTNTALSPDERARLLVAAMTLEEKLLIVHGQLGRARLGLPAPKGALGSAGYVPGVPRLGIPALQETDAGVGITNPANARPGDGATALPATIAVAASWNRDLSYRTGGVLGDEAWKKGFNVVLAGGANIMREPRNGRNFEYLGEDPLLAGMLAGDAIRGIQSHGVVSTVKHFALNNQETGRFVANVKVDEAAARESDLLAFQLAIEIGKPGSVMCAYNLVNDHYTCAHDWLLNRVLKADWGYPGWVMSDWGAVHSTEAAMQGLDQQSGEQLDSQVFFGPPLAAKVANDPAYRARLDDMVRRILRSLFAVGTMDRPPVAGTPIDYAANAAISQAAAEEGIVLLKNGAGLLPLKAAKKVAIIGGMAEFGVIAGGGSSYTTAIEGPGIQIPTMGVYAGGGVPRMRIYHPSSPLAALKAAMPDTRFILTDGSYPAAAAEMARQADVAIVFATQWTTESIDAADLSLPNGQDGLIAAVAAANLRTIVVLQTGGPVKMPWLNRVGAVVEAWYPGGRGGVAIANVLTGKVNPSGRLPVTFPADEAQLPRPGLLGLENSDPDSSRWTRFDLPYDEGADVGYRRFARLGKTPLFPFGYGLSYTSFDYSGLRVTGGTRPRVSFTVTNTGAVAGADVPQVYLTSLAGTAEQRLIGWDKVRLAPGESRRVELAVDRRLLARFDTKAQRWQVPGGRYEMAVGASATALRLRAPATIPAATLKP